MMSLFPILLVAVVLLADRGIALDGGDRETLAGGGWATFGAIVPMVVVLAVTALVVQRFERRLKRGRGVGSIAAVDRTLSVGRFVLLAAHAIAVLGLGWLTTIRSVIGDPILLDELVAILPPIAGVIGLWWLHYPVERRLRNALLIRHLDAGRPIHAVLSRGQYVIQQTRAQLLLLLVPVVCILGLAESVAVLADRSGRSIPEWQIEGATTASALLVLLVSPLIARVVLSLAPLGTGPVREELEEICNRHGIRVRDFLLWNTGGTMINAAVMGFLGPLRYVILTDGLIESMPREQVRAVMAHEIGHVKRHHMPWLLLCLIAFLLLASLLVSLPLYAIDVNTNWLPDSTIWVDTVATVVAGGAALLGFGWISRRYERQADTFAVQHLSGLGAPPPESDPDDVGPPHGEPIITSEAVRAMHDALGAVARLNTVDPTHRSWRHGSIAWRQAYLDSTVGRPILALPIDRFVRWSKAAVVATLILAGGSTAFIAWIETRPGAPAGVDGDPFHDEPAHVERESAS